MEPILNMIAAVKVSNVREFINFQWWGIALWQYFIALILLVFSTFARKMAEYIFNNIGKPWLNKIGSRYTSAIITAFLPPFTALLGVLGVYFAALILILPSNIQEVRNISGPIITSEWLKQVFQVAIATIIIWSLLRLVDVIAMFLRDKSKHEEIVIEDQIIPLIRKTLKVFIAIVGGIVVIQHLGYPIASLLGGLGIGGLAVALAAQDTLSNIFGSLIIFTDRPFKVGDWIQIGEIDGDVESIGFRSTRIRTWPKTLVTIPNKDVANSKIENLSAMPKRRVKFTLFVRHTTSVEQMNQLVNGIRSILTKHPGVNREYILVNFNEITEIGLGVFIYYFTSSTVWAEHMQVKQEINLACIKLAQDLGISLAVPPRVVYYDREERVSDTDSI